MCEWLPTTCCMIGAVWLCRLLWLLLVVPVVEVLWPGKLLDRLHTRAVLITGCDSGFGEALARRLDSLGVPVFAGCLMPQGPGAQGLANDCSSRLRVLPLDVTSEQQVADAVATVKSEISAKPDTELWAVVNNAGIGEYGEIDELPVRSYEKIFNVNTMGPIRVTKAFLALLKKSRGRVINVASPLGLFTSPHGSPYSMSKCALIMFSNILRMETKKWSVSVCTIMPGLYNTPITNVQRLKSQYAENLRTASSTEVVNEEKSVEFCEKFLSMFSKMADDDISDVVDEMVAACLGRNTKNERITGLLFKIIITAVLMLPQRCIELFYYIAYGLAEKL